MIRWCGNDWNGSAVSEPFYTWTATSIAPTDSWAKLLLTSFISHHIVSLLSPIVQASNYLWRWHWDPTRKASSNICDTRTTVLQSLYPRAPLPRVVSTPERPMLGCSCAHFSFDVLVDTLLTFNGSWFSITASSLGFEVVGQLRYRKGHFIPFYLMTSSESMENPSSREYLYWVVTILNVSWNDAAYEALSGPGQWHELILELSISLSGPWAWYQSSMRSYYVLSESCLLFILRIHWSQLPYSYTITRLFEHSQTQTMTPCLYNIHPYNRTCVYGW